MMLRSQLLLLLFCCTFPKVLSWVQPMYTNLKYFRSIPYGTKNNQCKRMGSRLVQKMNRYDGEDGGEELSELLSRFTSVRDKEIEHDKKLNRNWNSGNWIVRGFELDKKSVSAPPQRKKSDVPSEHIDDPDISLFSYNDEQSNDVSDPKVVSIHTNPRKDPFGFMKTDEDWDEENDPIYVSRVAVDEKESDDLVAVGRSDGSVYLVRVGTDYITSFKAVPKVFFEAVSDDGNDLSEEAPDDMSIVKVRSEMVRSDLVDEEEDMGELIKSSHSSDQDPFEIMHQFHHDEGSSSILNNPISALLLVDDSSTVYTAMEGSGEIKEWSLLDDTNESNKKPSKVFGEGIHLDTIVTLKTIESANFDKKYLFSASLDGSFALWDRETGSLLKKVLIPIDENDGESIDYSPVSILCADIEQDNGLTILYFGLNIGQIVGYSLDEIFSNDAEPRTSCRFFVDPNNKGGVTALKCGGSGSNSLSSKSSILISGGENGVIKQWEMITRKTSDSTTTASDKSSYMKIEYWPRLASQRLRQRAHVFKTKHGGKVNSIQILNLNNDEHYDDDDNDEEDDDPAQLILSAAADGSIHVSSPIGGEMCYHMDGFSSKISSLCLCENQNILITDGMQHFVCLHDFDADEDVDKLYTLEP